nr:TraU family protein [Mannheimia haemolytica]
MGEWPPGPVEEGQARTHKWQMLYPQMSNTCSVFPNGGQTDTYSSQISNQGDYGFSDFAKQIRTGSSCWCS